MNNSPKVLINPSGGSVLLESVVERLTGGLEVHVLYKLTGLHSTMLTVHTRIFPFDREGAIIIDAVQGADDLFKVGITAAGTGKIPEPSPVPERNMSAKYSRFFRNIRPFGILDMHMKNPVTETV